MMKLILAIASVLVLVPGGLRAQQDLCGPFAGCGGGHMIACPYGFGYRDCHAQCAGCAGPFNSSCHASCNVSILPGMPQDKARAYDALIAAAKEAPIKTLLSVAMEAKDFAFVNTSRGALQILGCDGVSIAASVPIPGALYKLAVSRIGTEPSGLLLAANRANELNGRLGVEASRKPNSTDLRKRQISVTSSLSEGLFQ